MTGDSLFSFGERSSASLRLIGAASFHQSEAIGDYDFIVNIASFGGGDTSVIDTSDAFLVGSIAMGLNRIMT